MPTVAPPLHKVPTLINGLDADPGGSENPVFASMNALLYEA
jgi:hypothetical protein